MAIKYFDCDFDDIIDIVFTLSNPGFVGWAAIVSSCRASSGRHFLFCMNWCGGYVNVFLFLTFLILYIHLIYIIFILLLYRIVIFIHIIPLLKDVFKYKTVVYYFS